jgi:hypothetical protein
MSLIALCFRFNINLDFFFKGKLKYCSCLLILGVSLPLERAILHSNMKYLMRTFLEEHFAVVVDPFPVRNQFSVKYFLELNANVHCVVVAAAAVVDMKMLANGHWMSMRLEIPTPDFRISILKSKKHKSQIK